MQEFPERHQETAWGSGSWWRRTFSTVLRLFGEHPLSKQRARPHAYTTSVGVYLQRIRGLNTVCMQLKTWTRWLIQRGGAYKFSPSSSSSHWWSIRTPTVGYSSHSSSSTRGARRTAEQNTRGQKYSQLHFNTLLSTGQHSNWYAHARSFPI